MIRQALDKYPGIDLSRSFLAGDSRADAGLADAVGLPFFGIGLPVERSVQGLADVPGRLIDHPFP